VIERGGVGEIVGVDEAGENFRGVEAGVVATATLVGEEALGTILLGIVNMAEQDLRAELESVLTMVEAQGVGIFVGVLRNLIRAAIAGVGEIGVVSADQRAATQQ
jgi:hypothetical protein